MIFEYSSPERFTYHMQQLVVLKSPNPTAENSDITLLLIGERVLTAAK